MSPSVPQVWPGGANFPDFGWNPQADVYWQEQLAQFDTLAPWDALWLDMNESELPPGFGRGCISRSRARRATHSHLCFGHGRGSSISRERACVQGRALRGGAPAPGRSAA